MPPSSSAVDKEREDGSIIKDPDVPEGSEVIRGDYHGGLGFEFKFPGDAKKYVLIYLNEVSSIHIPKATGRLKIEAMDGLSSMYA